MGRGNGGSVSEGSVFFGVGWVCKRCDKAINVARSMVPDEDILRQGIGQR